MKVSKGIITVSLVLMISFSLFFTILFYDEMLSSYQNIFEVRKNYIISRNNLTRNYQESYPFLCQHPKKWEFSKPKREFYYDEIVDKNDSVIKQYVLCQKISLFKISPTKNIQYDINEFINKESYKDFEEKIFLSEQERVKLYWFDKKENVFELNKNINAVIIAEGDLSIVGNGKIKGAIIIDGKLELGNGIQLSYGSSAVKSIYENYKKWKMVENSWFDYYPEKIE